MDRTWMYGARTTDAYRDGLRGFMAAAEAHMLREGRANTCYPCKDCGNIRIFELSSYPVPLGQERFHGRVFTLD